MSRTFRQILKDSNRTGTELGLVLVEKLKNQVQGGELIVTDKQISQMAKELGSPEELARFRLYELICSNVLNVYNFSRQTTFKFYASHNALQTMMDKSLIFEVSDNNHETPAEVLETVYKLCSGLNKLEGRTRETYDMMFDALSFIEASNVYIKLVLAHFNINGLSCLQYNTEGLYSLLERLNKSTDDFFKKIGPERAGKGHKVFFHIGGEEISRKDFVPEAKSVSEFKEFLRNETDRVINNAFSFIMLLQNKKNLIEEGN